MNGSPTPIGVLWNCHDLHIYKEPYEGDTNEYP